MTKPITPKEAILTGIPDKITSIAIYVLNRNIVDTFDCVNNIASFTSADMIERDPDREEIVTGYIREILRKKDYIIKVYEISGWHVEIHDHSNMDNSVIDASFEFKAI